jgi:glucan-binding YG repeat protein
VKQVTDAVAEDGDDAVAIGDAESMAAGVTVVTDGSDADALTQVLGVASVDTGADPEGDEQDPNAAYPFSWRHDEDGWRLVRRGTAGELSVMAVSQEQLPTGWVEDGYGLHYVDGETMLASDGLADVDGKSYFFDNGGEEIPPSVATGWIDSEEGWRYFDPEDGGASVTGWKRISGKWYMMGDDGIMLESEWVGGNGSPWYRLDANGAMATGWRLVDGQWYFLQQNGRMATGWSKAGTADWYFFGSSGAMKTGWRFDCGAWYFLSEDGRMRTGWLDYGGARYWFDGSGKMVTGLQFIDNGWRSFDSSGRLVSSYSVPGYFELPWWRQTVLDYAYASLGGVYVWGGESFKACDCSGLTMLAYGAAGIWLPHYSGSQSAFCSKSVWDAVPGDILWMPGHVGIYVGNGMTIEALGSGIQQSYLGRFSSSGSPV